ncbi:MAG: carboxy terminal-processing peptidase [Opitutaceae bacterium]
MAASVSGATDRKFTTSPTLAIEARTLIKILEEAHYNRDAVQAADYAQAIPDFMAELDSQHMFFLRSDKLKFAEKFGQGVYYNTGWLGNIDPAYEIFGVYETRTETRITWIFEELKKEIDFTAAESFGFDRGKAEWPDSVSEADDLWRKRLKFELLQEILNKKTTEQAKETVRKRYERWRKSNAEIDGNELAQLYLGTIAQLFDPHSTYFSPDTYEDFGINMKLHLKGIGALLSLEDDVCVVKEIVPGGPADLGRVLKPNDKIISVAQAGQEPVEIVGMKLRKIVDMIRGEKGSNVHLMVQPADATDPSVRKEIVITRDLVKLNSARAHAAIFQVPGADGKTQPLGVITLPAFYNEGDTDSEEPEQPKTTAGKNEILATTENGGANQKVSASKDVARLIEKLKQAGVQGIVLDLRHNGGGFLTEAIELTGLFIKQGPIVQVKNYQGQITVDDDTDSQIAYEGPLAVLVDRFSASASEIVTGALQNYGRAIVIGDSSTHGKGSVQQVVEMRQISPLRNALDPKTGAPVKTGAAKFTIQKYYLPSGDSTQQKGVVPDVVLPSIDDYIPGIGEASLPHVLAWDKIPTSFFDGAPLDPKILTPLRQSSLDRQNKLEEFTFLRKRVDWFKARQEQKLISLNLEERKQQKASDDAFQKAMKLERERVAQSDYAFSEVRLSPPPPPRIKAPKKDEDKTDEDLDVGADENESYPKADIHLRESLRIISDAVGLAQNRDLWVSARPPLTARVKG